MKIFHQRQDDGTTIEILVNVPHVKLAKPVEGGTLIRFGQGKPVVVIEDYETVRNELCIAVEFAMRGGRE